MLAVEPKEQGLVYLDTRMWGINECGLCSQMSMPSGSPLRSGEILSKRVRPSTPWSSYLYSQDNNTWQCCCKPVLISVLYPMLTFVQIWEFCSFENLKSSPSVYRFCRHGRLWFKGSAQCLSGPKLGIHLQYLFLMIIFMVQLIVRSHSSSVRQYELIIKARLWLQNLSDYWYYYSSPFIVCNSYVISFLCNSYFISLKLSLSPGSSSISFAHWSIIPSVNGMTYSPTGGANMVSSL